MAEWYPVMLNISEKKCLVAGGGPVAERKIAGLLSAGARVIVVSPQLTPKLRELADNGGILWIPREAVDDDLEGAALVFAATGEPDVNRRLAESARLLGIPANVADNGEAGDFMVPAVLRRGRFVLAAGVSGAGPALAARVVRELSARYGPEYSVYADALGHIRRAVKEHVADPEERRLLLLAAVEPDALEEWRQAGWLKSQPGKLLERLRSRAEAAKPKEENH
ncbi:bifunctional precorrin-2 dehydrogenase/sirohydrochlorin ferrochelatase [Cohnella pontilimi]|uniref:precorrin-2 dehydrogenase n=1 Tax=Cohnella pontilimi TaxID=2564100 RepID=A0A4U0FAA8_9BACL|nr:bifunctional precorrin-2 dehydrogenase/sirohydrochlorin ferrochelatase [Cohnella pontilimi]TJY41458.1 bifunctional precorrin-2 dehydrogenase/sirohydrochlorin ferrochelatase [Cohnella pontilimi]